MEFNTSGTKKKKDDLFAMVNVKEEAESDVARPADMA